MALAAAALAIGAAAAAGAPAGRTDSRERFRPNLILILTDDQGYGDLGVTGNPIVHTPNVDALARRSASLSEFYVSPVCSPSRACLFTGRYNYRSGVVDTFLGRSMMNPSEVTLAQLLHGAGYATALFGKWHLGDCYPLRPIDRGFDEELTLRGGGLAQNSEPIENRRRYTDPILIHNGTEVATKGYCTDVFFDAALQFIDQTRAAGRPFFLCLTTNAPHRPVDDVPADLYEKYRKMDLTPVLLGNRGDADYVARVYAMEENIDQNVGRLQARLAATGLLANTVVIYMSDNGPDSYRWVGPFRGKKTEVFEGGVRTPFFMQWPARLRAGATSDHLVAHIDLMPTLLEAAGVPVPADLKLDGRSFLPLLEDPCAAWPDRTIVMQEHRGDVPVRFHNFEIRNERWKLVHASGFASETMPAGVPFQLFDIRQDPAERRDVAADHPELVHRFKSAYAAWFDDVSGTRPANYAPVRIIVGTQHETRTVLTRQDWRVGPSGSPAAGHGHWVLRFATAQAYDAELRWPKALEPAAIELTVGSVKWHLDAGRAFDRITFRDVRIPAGEADLSVTVTHPGAKTEEAYQVTLTQRLGLGISARAAPPPSIRSS